MKQVTAVVLNWNRWSDTLACVASLQHQDYANLKVLIVDNDSTDDSVKQIRAAVPGIELLQSGDNLGFGGGCNVGIRRAIAEGADYVWLINSDSTADAHALSALVDVAEQNPALGSVGSVLYEVDVPTQIQLWGGGRVRLCCGQSRHQTAPSPLDFISGASILLRRDALVAVGMFDQSAYFMYWEDTDLGFRLRKAGWQLGVAEDSRVWHKQSASLGKGNPLLDEYFTRSGVRFLRRYAPIPSISILFMLGMMLAKRSLMGEWRRVQAVVKGFWEA
ncbi:glycosyltransferase family 2 protein [Rhodoferax sp. BLA1]|uniref:glycosyltransferase family 2 protein n=1 Tax=Rhodoferax sp. BLA1 TaxID=2576062 RepID=UPI0015D45C6E|nr:glycosyltransferase family 2 protein [Rhodoferax sp. BLA1]